MGTTTMGVKLDDATRERIKSAATRIDRTPHWLIKQAIFSYLEQLENSDTLRSYLRCFLARPMRAMKHRLRQRNHTSLSSTLPSKFCPSRFPAPRSPRPIAARKPKRFRCCWNKPACRNQLLNRRINWRINWPINCVIKKMPVVAQVWSRVIAGVFAVIAGRRGADVSGRSVVAYSRQSHPGRVNSRQNQQR